MKLTADKVNWIIQHACLFGMVFAGMWSTFFFLVFPVGLIGLPIALFAKSKRAKSLAIAALLGYVAWIPIALLCDIRHI